MKDKLKPTLFCEYVKNKLIEKQDILIEQAINELSKSILHSYANKAIIDQKKQARKYVEDGDENNLRKFNNRMSGLTHAYFAEPKRKVEEEELSERNELNKIKKNAAEAALGSGPQQQYFTSDQLNKIHNMINRKGTVAGQKYALSFKSKDIHKGREQLKK